MIGRISSSTLPRLSVYQNPDIKNVSRLSHNLESLLKIKGPVFVPDERIAMKEYSITQPIDFNYDALNPYKISSSDQSLHTIASKSKSKFYTSTSSMTESLVYLYIFLCRKRPTALSGLKSFQNTPFTFPISFREPIAFNMIMRDDIYAIDKVSDDISSIFSQLGLSMEKWLVMNPEEYKKLLSINADLNIKVPKDEFNYAVFEEMLVRSQIDCYSDILGGTFDLKTRAMANLRWGRNLGVLGPVGVKMYSEFGKFNSHEREIYDMVRGPLMKYCFQGRLGNMKGIFLCYHNTAEALCFQYLSQQEMEQYVFGNDIFANQIFNVLMELFQTILKEMSTRYYGKNMTIHLRINNENDNELFIRAHPVSSSSEQNESDNYLLTFETLSNSEKVSLSSLELDQSPDFHLDYKLTKTN